MAEINFVSTREPDIPIHFEEKKQTNRKRVLVNVCTPLTLSLIIILPCSSHALENHHVLSLELLQIVRAILAMTYPTP